MVSRSPLGFPVSLWSPPGTCTTARATVLLHACQLCALLCCLASGKSAVGVGGAVHFLSKESPICPWVAAGLALEFSVWELSQHGCPTLSQPPGCS